MKQKPQEVDFDILPPRDPSPTPRGGSASKVDDPFIALVAKLMDTVFVIPGTNIRFGIDPLLGLIPGLGDTASAAVSLVLIAQSARYGVPKVVIARMAMNVLLNAGIGAIPGVGDFFSFWFKSNQKNYELLQKHAGAQRRASRADWAFVFGILGALVFVIVCLLIGAATLISKLWSAIF